MTYGTHMLGGAVVGVVVLSITGVEQNVAPLILGSAIMGSLLPDIDHTQSKISRSNAGTSILSSFVGLLTKHRGIIHTPLFMLILAIAAVSAIIAIPMQFKADAIQITLGILAGFFSHLLLDTLNPGGIMWLYPISKKHFHIAQIKTGKLGEVLVAGCMVLILALFFTQYF